MIAHPIRSHRHEDARRMLPGGGLVCLGILLAALSGCGDGSPVQPKPPGPRYLPSSTPLHTLENMRRAYLYRDSTGYDSLFDASYTGSSLDQGDPSPTILNFYKSDEARHIAALARSTTIVRVDLFFPPGLSRDRDLSDPPGWARVQMNTVVLEIDDGPTSYLVAPNEAMEFRFAPTAPSPGSPTDTTWHIVRWNEVKP